MPSFDVVSELDKHQVTNAIDQSNRVVANRFDFKGVDARFEYANKAVTMRAEADIQIQQMLDILRQTLVKAGIDLACMQEKDIEHSGKTVKQVVLLREGIEQGYIRSDIDVDGTAEAIVAIPFGIATRHGQKPDRDGLVAQTRATTDLVCRGIAAEWSTALLSGQVR